jgi:ATP-binding cassette subfamily B protein
MFVREAELLMIDDLSSALDVETESLLWRRLFERREVTCIVASHRRAALKRADRIILLNDGGLLADGPLEELLRDQPLMRDLWESSPAGIEELG